MIDFLKTYVKDKRVAVLGFGREGKSTLKQLLIAKGFEKVTILDKNPIAAEDIKNICGEADFPLSQIEIITGGEYQKSLDDYQVVIKSPGIVLEKDISLYKTNITSQTELFFEKYRKQIIGITGTKGKSTTTTLIYHILDNAGYKSVLAGNIGIPAFDIADKVEKDTVIVFEMSSHMLEYMKVSPHIGVFLNIHEEHLDHYGTMEKYVAAKKNIYKNQKKEDICFVNAQLEATGISKIVPIYSVNSEAEGGISDKDAIVNAHNKAIYIENNKKYTYSIPVGDISLIGEHNYYDISVAFGVLTHIGVKKEEFDKGLRCYKALPHRLELVGVINGIKYYDDSISTICDTTINALNSIKDADTVLIGGMDRGIDYTELIDYLSTGGVSHIILMYETGERIYKEILEKGDFKGFERVIKVKDLAQAVKTATEVTGVGKSCVLSPAAASYGYFKNFEERGEKFFELVNSYKK